MIYETTRLEELRAIRDKLDILIDRVETGRDLPPKRRLRKERHDKQSRI